MSSLSARGHDLLPINASQPIPKEEWDPLRPQGFCLPDKPDVQQTSERDPCQPADSGRADRYENRRDCPPLSPSQADGSGISGAPPIPQFAVSRLPSNPLQASEMASRFASTAFGEDREELRIIASLGGEEEGRDIQLNAFICCWQLFKPTAEARSDKSEC
ncbi:unnamed protein product [Leuciscus chuanchicus]